MKKFIYSMFALAISAMTFTSCEDVPAPYSLPGNEETVVIEPTGNGTLESPFNVMAVLNYVNELPADVESTEDVYIKGKVVSVTTNYDESDPQFGNAVFYISDDGTANNQFYVYRALYLGNKKYSSGTTLQKGDEVIICGKVVNYRGTTPETVQSKAFLYALNGESQGGGGGGGGGEAKGSGTLEDPYNPVAAANAVKDLTWTSTTEYQKTGDVYVKGKISRIAPNGTFTEGGTYGNSSFYISEDGSENGEFYCFRILYLGNKKFESGQTDIQVGDEVIVYGKLMNYRGNTPETVAGEAYLYSLNGATEGGSGSGGGGSTGEVKAVTIAAFNAAEESNSQVYELVGTIGGSINTTYGNFDLTDETGTVYVYGLTATNLGYGAQNDKSYSSLNLAAGDKIKIRGYRGSYNDKIEMMYGWFIEKLASGGGGGSEGGGESAFPTSGDNGNFEAWADGIPTNWKPASSAGNAKLAQSTDAHGGSFSVKVSGDAGANKRLGYKELSLKKGTYTVVFYAKALAEGGSLNPGFVPINNGTAGTYKYSGYIDNVSTDSWQKVEATLDIPSDGTYCFVVMNQKKTTAIDILIDDFTVTMGGTEIVK